jgi:hypothetical protein
MNKSENMDKIFQNLSLIYVHHLHCIINDISSNVSEDKNVSKDEIINIWNEICPEYPIGVKTKKTINKICEYIGKKNAKCNSKVSVNSKTGIYCFRHLKYEDTNLNKENNSGDNNSQSSGVRNNNTSNNLSSNNNLSENELKEKSCKKFLIKYNRKAKLYIDEDYGYVFDRLTKSIYGKWINNEIQNLTCTDINFIKSNGGIIKE